MKHREAIYAGSFDPMTNGHAWVIERAVTLFDELTIAIGENPEKKYFFSAEERKQHIQATLDQIASEACKVHVEIIHNQFLARYAKNKGVSCLVRGVRSEADFSYEYAMATVNRNLEPSVDTIYLMPPPRLAQISSSLVKSMVGPEGWQGLVEAYVPPAVFKALQDK